MFSASAIVTSAMCICVSLRYKVAFAKVLGILKDHMLALQIGQECSSMGQSLHLALNSVFGCVMFKYIFRYTDFNENIWSSCCTQNKALGGRGLK